MGTPPVSSRPLRPHSFLRLSQRQRADSILGRLSATAGGQNRLQDEQQRLDDHEMLNGELRRVIEWGILEDVWVT